MKKKIRVNGWLSGEKEVILGYVENNQEMLILMREYVDVFGEEIDFRIRWVQMIPYEKAVALSNLFSILFAPMQNLTQELTNILKSKKDYGKN